MILAIKSSETKEAVLQHNSVGKSLHWHVIVNAKVGIFPPSYVVIPSFISCFTTFYRLDPYFIFKLTIFNILAFSLFLLHM